MTMAICVLDGYTKNISADLEYGSDELALSYCYVVEYVLTIIAYTNNHVYTMHQSRILGQAYLAQVSDQKQDQKQNRSSYTLDQLLIK